MTLYPIPKALPGGLSWLSHQRGGSGNGRRGSGTHAPQIPTVTTSPQHLLCIGRHIIQHPSGILKPGTPAPVQCWLRIPTQIVGELSSDISLPRIATSPHPADDCSCIDQCHVCSWCWGGLLSKYPPKSLAQEWSVLSEHLFIRPAPPNS